MLYAMLYTFIYIRLYTMVYMMIYVMIYIMIHSIITQLLYHSLWHVQVMLQVEYINACIHAAGPDSPLYSLGCHSLRIHMTNWLRSSWPTLGDIHWNPSLTTPFCGVQKSVRKTPQKGNQQPQVRPLCTWVSYFDSGWVDWSISTFKYIGLKFYYF